MQLGRYSVVREIARGGMGAVLLAWDPVTQRQVAVKQLLRGVQGDQAGAKRFQREAEALGALNHPHIVRIHGAERHGSHLLLVQEFVEGANLAEQLSRGPLPERRAAEICRDLANALHHAHRAGLIHRDVKPANVILRSSGEPVLIDFGLVKNLDLEQRLSQTGIAMGSPGYWSPEQATGEWRKIDPRTDVYSLGATLYALLTGGPPFAGSNVAGNAILTVAESPRSPREHRPNLSRQLEAICLRCLEKSPEDRYESAQELENALESYLVGEKSVVPGLIGILVTVAALALAVVALVAPRPQAKNFAARAGASPALPRGSNAAGKRVSSTGKEATGPPWFEALPRKRKPVALPKGVTPTSTPGEYINAKDGSILVYVPGGEFLMGYPEARGEFGSLMKVRWNDRPAHLVTLSGYFVGKYEVTWKQYRRFARSHPEYAISESEATLKHEGQVYEANDDFPAWCLHWKEARAYCDWAGLRLPSEAEWEFAARGESQEHFYPWGERLQVGMANLFGELDGAAGPVAVGRFDKDRSPYGVMDMCGNVSEWTMDYLGPYRREAVRDPQGPAVSRLTWAGVHGWRPLRSDEGALRVLRGGAWRTSDGAPPKLDPYAEGAYYYQVTRRYAGFEGAKDRVPLTGVRVASGAEQRQQ